MNPPHRPDENDDQPVINIVGERVALGPHRRDLLPLYHRWLNDFEVARTAGLMFYPLTREAVDAWYEQIAGNTRAVEGTVYECDSLRPVGITGLAEIERHHGTAEFWINLGARDCWGKGYGSETTRLILVYGFTTVGLENILLRVHSFSTRSIAAYSRAGFQLTGRRRKVIRVGGRRYDDLYMDCITAEFHGSALRWLLPTE